MVGEEGRTRGPCSHGDLVDDAGRIGSVLHGVSGAEPWGGHQVGHGACGAQGCGRRVGVEVRAGWGGWAAAAAARWGCTVP